MVTVIAGSMAEGRRGTGTVAESTHSDPHDLREPTENVWAF